MDKYKPPFPWFGGKSRVSDIVWERFGDVPNYIEPFFGSGAVMFMRPHRAKNEVINDKDCYVANFWRALQSDPDKLTYYADVPVNEADLLARNKWIKKQHDFQMMIKSDPDYYDVKIAGWWVWGVNAWIGRGWCDARRCSESKVPRVIQSGVNRVCYRNDPDSLRDYMRALSERLRYVTVACGEWNRITTPAFLGSSVTAVFLDPPYCNPARDKNVYAVDSMTVAKDVYKWAIEHANAPEIRIALCGYEGDFTPPDGWETVEWVAHGGYANNNKNGNINRHKERVWFSPHCLKPVNERPRLDI